MTLLNNILHWTETKLTAWQQDAARRLFQQEDGLSNDDYSEVYALLKAAHGLPNPLGLTPVPLKSSHLPTTLQDGETVILNAIRDLNHVNRIAPGQKLTFAASGMTVIYGGNGSGKSGYTRVMKRACRARDLVEKVHTDAHDTVAQNHVPEALFDIEINGSPKTVQWTSGNDSPFELSSIAVFDSHCARSYLTAEHEVAYSFLRATIERVVQDFVLNATVQRFRDYIEVKNLEKVVGLEQSEVDEIARQYQRCHDLVEAHDPSSAKDDPPPTADELDQDISALKTLIQVISNRRKGVTT